MKRHSREELNTLYGMRFMRKVTKNDSAAGEALVHAISDLCSGVRSVVDLGCANGVFMQHFLDAGYDIVGYDISTASHDMAIVPKELIHIADLREPIDFSKRCDLALVIETIEHIEPEAVGGFLANLKKAALLVIVTPGAQPGTGHFTCRTSAEWIPIFEQNGFVYDQKFSHELHEYLSQPRWDECQSKFPFMRKGIMAYRS